MKTTPFPSPLTTIVKNFRRGETDAITPELIAKLTSLITDEDLASEVRLEARARVAQYHLLMIRKEKAAEVLDLFVEPTGKHKLRMFQEEIEKLVMARTIPAGLVLAQLANLQYRYFEYEAGAELARHADGILRMRDVGGDLDQVLAEYENRVWWARLQWHCGRHTDAAALLKETIRDLTKLLANVSETGGIHLLVALALDLWASFDLRNGDIREARRKIYHSLFLLRGGEVRSRVRLGHALYMAGRIEMSHTLSTTWTEYLLDKAAEVFHESKHQFEFRTRIQKAQCMTRAGHGEDALAEITQIRDDMKAADIDADERDYVQADILLTQVWAGEARASEDPAVWQDCAKLAKDLVAIEYLPPRLKVEGDLHYGLALVHLPHKSDRERGARCLGETVKRAQEKHLRKIEVAAHFALAEYYVENGDPDVGRKAWQAGADLLASIRSSFLYRWKERLSSSFSDKTLFDFDMNLKLDDALREFTRRYIAHHEQLSKDREDLWENIGVKPARGFRLLKEVRKNAGPGKS